MRERKPQSSAISDGSAPRLLPGSCISNFRTLVSSPLTPPHPGNEVHSMAGISPVGSWPHRGQRSDDATPRSQPGEVLRNSDDDDARSSHASLDLETVRPCTDPFDGLDGSKGSLVRGGKEYDGFGVRHHPNGFIKIPRDS